MHIVIYRWQLKPGGEAIFREGWHEMTIAIYQHKGSLGSRLHQAEDGTWVATAQWPSRAAWEESQRLGSASDSARQKMLAGVEQFLGEEHLEVVDDLCQSSPYKHVSQTK